MKKWPTYKELYKECEELEDKLSDMQCVLEEKIWVLANYGFHDGRGGDYEAAASCCWDIRQITEEYLDTIRRIR